ncbi:protein of unknown function [Candidatus Hydrogenisulfobacillus filiaventi]|uniref:Uncharacterized protein n=1 Tax=Candidatus Hydrogenisulfobacillus filiaventi TaxID=2707344 RepID=A0A6F8ZI20_9FIRM|nr:protein of unknown function [Candidatus Hydrogenisulfobacillus filiaventi]CAB1129445.1 protein of unknown function [Candidatus Hydrogenisulfobacillus filiaventi]
MQASEGWVPGQLVPGPGWAIAKRWRWQYTQQEAPEQTTVNGQTVIQCAPVGAPSKTRQWQAEEVYDPNLCPYVTSVPTN